MSSVPPRASVAKNRASVSKNQENTCKSSKIDDAIDGRSSVASQRPSVTNSIKNMILVMSKRLSVLHAPISEGGEKHPLQTTTTEESETSKEEEKYEAKILLLGSESSGKQTFLRQCKILIGGGFSDQDRVSAVRNIRAIIFGMTLKIVDELIEFEYRETNQVSIIISRKLVQLIINQFSTRNSLFFKDFMMTRLQKSIIHP